MTIIMPTITVKVQLFLPCLTFISLAVQLDNDCSYRYNLPYTYCLQYGQYIWMKAVSARESMTGVYELFFWNQILLQSKQALV